MDVKNLYYKLSAKFPEASIQRTKKSETRKGYDTTGISYQFIVNRFNEVFGIFGWSNDNEIIAVYEGKFKSGQPYYDVTIQVTITINEGSLVTKRSCYGGHISSSYGDACKGAMTNAFKKTAALFGVGKEAYEGTIDEDAVYEDEIGDRIDAKEAKPHTEAVEHKQVDKKPDTSKTEKVTHKEVQLLNYDELFNKIASSDNIFELMNRCKKYRASYDALTEAERSVILEERDRRKLYIDTGKLGDYKDFKVVEKK